MVVMKKMLLAMLSVLLVLGLCGCGQAESGQSGMYIKQAELSTAEQNIANLLESDGMQLVLDFAADDSARTIYFNTYKLIDGEWQLVDQANMGLDDAKGRLGLIYNRNYAKLVHVGMQNDYGISRIDYDTQEDEKLPSQYGVCATMNDSPIVYEQDILLFVQVITEDDNLAYPSDIIGYFDEPERLLEANPGSEFSAYALTVVFSQNENSTDN
jgi:hypothetical protein